MRQWTRSVAAILMTLLGAALIAASVAGCAGAGTKTGEYVDDSAITTKVKADMAADKEVSSLKVHVVTDHGVVILSGVVDSETARRRAGHIARSVAGVRAVENDLTVEGG
jgi:osmotically-inducible protein OsmY